MEHNNSLLSYVGRIKTRSLTYVKFSTEAFLEEGVKWEIKSLQAWLLPVPGQIKIVVDNF